MTEPKSQPARSFRMRYAIRQTPPNQRLWLVRTTKKGVWGSSERAFGFFRRPTAERWLLRLAKATSDLSLEIVEVNSRPAMATPPVGGESSPDEIVTMAVAPAT